MQTARLAFDQTFSGYERETFRFIDVKHIFFLWFGSSGSSRNIPGTRMCRPPVRCVQTPAGR